MIQNVKRHPIAWGLSVVVVLPLLVFVVWTFSALNFTYSSGEHAGFLQKISKRGWVCKTWEGDLQLSVVPGIAPTHFNFTVRSDSIATVLNNLAGRQIVVNYEQHKGLPGSCFGDTEYFVTGARATGGT